MGAWINEDFEKQINTELDSLKKIIEILIPLPNSTCIRILRYCLSLINSPTEAAPAGMDIQALVHKFLEEQRGKEK